MKVYVFPFFFKSRNTVFGPIGWCFSTICVEVMTMIKTCWSNRTVTGPLRELQPTLWVSALYSEVYPGRAQGACVTLCTNMLYTFIVPCTFTFVLFPISKDGSACNAYIYFGNKDSFQYVFVFCFLWQQLCLP